MTAKHSPATSLPWTYNDPYRGNIPQPENPRKVNIYSDGYEAVSCAWVDHRGTDRAKANAAYIVHAANAYPKLVAALRGMREQVECLNAQQAFGDDYEIAANLLRKLGEAD